MNLDNKSQNYCTANNQLQCICTTTNHSNVFEQQQTANYNNTFEQQTHNQPQHILFLSSLLLLHIM